MLIRFEEKQKGHTTLTLPCLQATTKSTTKMTPSFGIFTGRFFHIHTNPSPPSPYINPHPFPHRSPHSNHQAYLPILNNGPLQNPLHFLIPSHRPILHPQLCSHLQHPKPLLLHGLGCGSPRRGHAAWLRPILEPQCECRHHRRPCLGPYQLQLRCVREWEV